MEIKLFVLHHIVKGADLNSSSSWSHPTLLTAPPHWECIRKLASLAQGPIMKSLELQSLPAPSFPPKIPPKFCSRDSAELMLPSHQSPFLPHFHGHWLLLRSSPGARTEEAEELSPPSPSITRLQSRVDSVSCFLRGFEEAAAILFVSVFILGPCPWSLIWLPEAGLEALCPHSPVLSFPSVSQ